jgi:hypothetical protein
MELQVSEEREPTEWAWGQEASERWGRRYVERYGAQKEKEGEESHD